MRKNLTFLLNNIIAHRGYHKKELGIPENSIPAFIRAIENNYIIELDVHVLKDNNIIVFHDDNLKRMTGIDKNIKELTYDELKNVKLYNTNYTIPLLSEVLSIVDGKVPILIELKYDVRNHRLEDNLMKILKEYNGEYAVQSFDPFILSYFKRKYPNIIRGQLSYDFNNKKMHYFKKYILSHMKLNFISKPDFISYGVNSPLIYKLKRNKIVLGWVIRNKNDYVKLKKYCDNFICENIEEII